MAKVYIKPYGSYEISGKDFPIVLSANMRRFVFSPNNHHSLSVCELRDGCLLISNNSRTPFSFSISRNQKVLAVINYVATNDGALNINTNWRLSINGLENFFIHSNPDLIPSADMNMEIAGDGLARIDLKMDESGYAACAFSKKELLFVKFNGNHTFPRLEGFVEAEVQRQVAARLGDEIRRIANDPADQAYPRLDGHIDGIVQQRLANELERIVNDPTHEIFKRIGKQHFEMCLHKAMNE